MYAGPFLAGTLHAIKPFGPSVTNRMVFVRHQSCIECEPWIYVTVIDFSKVPNGAAFEFTYSRDHTAFVQTIEYELPGMGHSIDAEVETRIPPVFDVKGPHLIQHFKLEEGGHEWWVFTCKGLQCDYEMYLDQLPKQYEALWNKAERL